MNLRPDAPLVRRDHALLVEEIARLESLLQKTRPKSPDRAALVLRLANGYAELTALEEREHTLREIETDAALHELERSERPHAPARNAGESTTKTPHPLGPPRRPVRL